MSTISIISNIEEINLYRSTNTLPTSYKLTITSEGTLQDMEIIRDKLLNINNSSEGRII